MLIISNYMDASEAISQLKGNFLLGGDNTENSAITFGDRDKGVEVGGMYCS